MPLTEPGCFVTDVSTYLNGAGSADLDLGNLVLHLEFELEDLPGLIVDRPLAVDLGNGEVVEILVDLNAEDWLQAVDPLTGTVSAEAFASFIEVRVQ